MNLSNTGINMPGGIVNVSNLGYPSIINNNIQGLSINYSNHIHAPPGFEGDRIDLALQNSDKKLNYQHNQSEYLTNPKGAINQY